jgi:hypothetical protein
VQRKVVRTFDSMEALGDAIAAGVDGLPRDEEPFRDMDGNPMTPQQVLDLAREIERETGRKLIFRRGERRPAA